MQKGKTIKIPSNIAYQLEQLDSNLARTYYLTLFNASTQSSYIVDMRLEKPNSLPISIQKQNIIEVIQQQVSQQNKKQVLDKYQPCTCDELNQLVQKFIIINVGIQGFCTLSVQVKGFRLIGSKNQIKSNETVGADNFLEIFKACRNQAQDIWSDYNSKYCRSFADKKNKQGIQLACGIQNFLQFEVSSLASPKFSQDLNRGVQQLQGYNMQCSLIFSYEVDSSVKDLSKKVKQIIQEKYQQKLSQNNNKKIMEIKVPYLSCTRGNPSKIFNPHIYSKFPKKQKYELFTVKGMYQYYHYGDQSFADNGWGCAYRALQTLISWLHIQGHTEPMKQMMTIREIQEKLDQFDRSRKLKGSSTWIGATEISWMVPSITINSLNCKILHVSDGKRIMQKCEQFKNHFLTSGCPIMYGGGEYAYSIVGMHYNWKFGQCQFLILDPHYTGEDDYGKIVQKKGLVWRKPDQMFKAGVFYNFCLPIIK